MSSLQHQIHASPNARLGELSIGTKTIELPSHFVTLTKMTDVDKLLEAIQHLESEGEDPPLPNTGGFITELQAAREILEGEWETHQGAAHEQAQLDGEEARVNFYSMIEDLDRALIIDPNTDRMFYSNYREDFEDFSMEMANGLSEIFERYADEEDDLKSHAKAFKQLRRSARPSAFCEYIIEQQSQLGADLFLPPYYPIERAGIGRGDEEDLWSEEARQQAGVDEIPENIRLYKIAKDISHRRYVQDIAPVIPLKTDILRADAENGDNGMKPPEVWRNIMEEYSKLNCSAYFLKITNANIDPDTVDKRDSEGIVNFVKLFREEYTDAPVFFLGMDELAYVLMAHGLDIYAHPIYDPPFNSGRGFSPDARHDPEDINHNRKFIVPRKREIKKFDQLDSLGCYCPFCEPFVNTDPADISIGKQDDLRKKHWLWLRDEEIEQMKEAIKNDQVRPALMDFYTDSDWEKNYIKFL